jgi:3-hydroxymyristoyl/3-hydroxydecanoyl-(acyl carrier protein) dehydratase
MQVEIVAQCLGFLALELSEYCRLPVLIGVNRSRFRRPLIPGSNVVCRATVTYMTDRMVAGSGELFVGGQAIAAAELQLGLTSFPNLQTKAALTEFARTLFQAAGGEDGNE